MFKPVISAGPMPLEAEAWKLRIRASIAGHTRYVHGLYLKPHQTVWAPYLENIRGYNRVIIIAAPKFGKSPFIGLDYLGWRIGNDPEGYHCIYCSNTSRQSNKNSVALRDTITGNANFKLLYTDSGHPNGIEPDYNKGWGESEWYVKRENQSDKDPTVQACGVGGPVLGATVDEVVMDDVADEENMATAYQREKVVEWLKTTLMSRLVPGGRAIMICCMTGETPVLMLDGSERPLREIKVGDQVATYDNGNLSISTVLHHASNGSDNIFKITTSCGKIVHANERHPFLVEECGQLKWVRLKNLTTAHKIVALKDNRVNGKARCASSRIVGNQSCAEDTVHRTTARRSGPTEVARRHVVLNLVVAPTSNNTSDFTADFIVSIEPAGVAEVFDVQIDGTENFIANGLVSHNTRWHEEDPAAEFEKAGWLVIRLPALDANGESTYPEYWTTAALQQRRSDEDMGLRKFELMFQGNVMPAEGAIFKHEYWRYWDQPTSENPLGLAPWQFPPGHPLHRPILSVVQSWDTAHKEKRQNDYSVCETWYVLNNGYYLVDLWRQKLEFPRLKVAMMATWEQHHAYLVLIEDAASGVDLIPELRDKTLMPIIAVSVERDKVARANTATPALATGRVWIPKNAVWRAEFEHEHEIFPSGAHDDQVDTTTQFLNWARANVVTGPKTPSETTQKSRWR